MAAASASRVSEKLRDHVTVAVQLCGLMLPGRQPARVRSEFGAHSEANFSGRVAAALITRLSRWWVRSELGKR